MTPSNLDLIAMLDAVAYEFRDAHLVGNQCAKNEGRWKRMQDPRPGDLVSEISTGCMRLRDRTENLLRGSARTAHISCETGIGILVKKAREPIDGEWEEAEDGPRPLETVWYIRRLDGGTKESPHGEDVFRWTNADFVTILPKEGWGPWSKVLPEEAA